MSENQQIEQNPTVKKPLLTAGVKSLLGQFLALAIVFLFFAVS